MELGFGMRILYHYTCHNNLCGIFRSGVIRRGTVMTGRNERRANYAVCLTSDVRPACHGLPDGRELSREESIELDHYREEGAKRFSLDFTRYRLAIEIPENDTNLIYVPDVLSKWPDVLESLEARAHHPCTRTLSSDQMEETSAQMRSGEKERKGNTWWYYTNDIPLVWITEVGARQEGAVDEPYTLYTVPQTRDLLAEKVREESGR